MKPFPNPETLKKVIAERTESDEVIGKEGYINAEYGKTLYMDKKGLIHKNDPSGDIIDYIGYTNEQKEKLKNSDTIAPMPR
jgi:hypothetical protein